MEITLSPIGVIQRIENGRLYVRRIDTIDGTPLLDIKYVPKFDKQENVRTGRLEAAQERVRKHRFDGRFQLAEKGDRHLLLERLARKENMQEFRNRTTCMWGICSKSTDDGFFSRRRSA